MKTVIMRIILILLCVTLPCGAMAETAAPAQPVVHADFTLGMNLHADGFPAVDLHVADWEQYLQRISLAGSLDVRNFLKPDNRFYLQSVLRLDDQESIPLVVDGYGTNRYLMTPMLRNEPVKFHMHSYIEFMMKFFYYQGLPMNYVALLTYPETIWYVADQYATVVADAFATARKAAAVSEGDTTTPLTYTLSYEEMQSLCASLNAIVTEDKNKRVRWVLGALLAELYLSDITLEAISQLDLLLLLLDPAKQGMTVTETAEGIRCEIGGREIFRKETAGDTTDIVFTLLFSDTVDASFVYHGQTQDEVLSLSAEFSVTDGEDKLIWATAQGDGLPTESALEGVGQLHLSAGGSLIGEELTPQTLQLSWTRSAAELPSTIDYTLDWLHPQTGLPALSLHLSAALQPGDDDVFVDAEYPSDHFFGLNPDKLTEYKQRWMNSIIVYMLPVALSMPTGVIDDVVAFLLDSGILLSIMD